MPSIKVIGLASGKIIKIPTGRSGVTDQSLMDFLQSKNIPIASSCHGEGVCRLCVVNKDILSCQITLKQFLEQSSDLQVSISYF